MEIQLRILQYALTSKHPIIDPLSKPQPDNMTAAEKTTRENQIAIGFLATCKAFQVEGKRALWGHNTFTFTSHTALRNFANLEPEYRDGIKHINLRVIAKFYDDVQRNHKIPKSYHPSLKKDVALKVHMRPKESNLARKGFRVYAWAQLIDFLSALLPPHRRNMDKTKSRQRLLPNLESMRIDFVNFPEDYLPYSGSDLHEVAAHENGCTLNELMVTGLPCCEQGMKAGAECSGMLKDNGLFMDAGPSFIQLKTQLKPLTGKDFCKKVIRAWMSPSDAHAAHHHHSRDSHPVRMHQAPDPPNAPVSKYARPTVWKLVPNSRDSAKRRWVEFDRKMGYSVKEMQDDIGIDMDFYDSDLEDEDDLMDMDEMLEFPICYKCGDAHPPWD
jgi:hypothetical protein